MTNVNLVRTFVLPILQASREKIRPAAETIAAVAGNRGTSQPVWSVPFDNMGAERKEAVLPGASQPIAGNVSQASGGGRVQYRRVIRVGGIPPSPF